MGSTSAWDGPKPDGSSAFIKMFGSRRDGTDASQNNSMKQNAGSGRSALRGFMASARSSRREIASQPLAAERIGWVVDRGRMLRGGPELPALVATLDELLLVVRRDTPLRFDPALEFHLYGADICLQARELGLAVVALAAPCHHNSRSVGLPDAFFASAKSSPANGATGCRSQRHA